MKNTPKILIIEHFQEDHVYYDNPYNISIIHTYEGCPFAFEFENIDDLERALISITNHFQDQDCGWRITVSKIFEIFGLIMDDYPGFENNFACWTNNDFCAENMIYIWQRYLSFGTMEAPKEAMK